MASLPPLEHALATALPGFAVLDRDLAVRDGARDVRATLAGLDGLGRLWLVVVADEGADPERALLDALALLAFAREHRGVLSAQAEETRVAIVCSSAGDELARRAAPVAAIEVFVRESWSSANGVHETLARRGPGADAEPETPARFLAGLGARERGLAELCLERVPRLAGSVEVRAGADRLAWRGAGRELGQLARREHGLTARAGRGGTNVELASEADVERWLAALLDEHLGEAPDDDLAPLPESDPRPGPGGVLLSPEELAAFSD